MRKDVLALTSTRGGQVYTWKELDEHCCVPRLSRPLGFLNYNCNDCLLGHTLIPLRVSLTHHESFPVIMDENNMSNQPWKPQGSCYIPPPGVPRPSCFAEPAGPEEKACRGRRLGGQSHLSSAGLAFIHPALVFLSSGDGKHMCPFSFCHVWGLLQETTWSLPFYLESALLNTRQGWSMGLRGSFSALFLHLKPLPSRGSSNMERAEFM